MYRVLRLIKNCPNQSIDYDRVRIFDYFYAFPYQAEKIRFVQNSGYKKNDFKLPKNKYFSIQDDKQLFFELAGVVDSAVRCLAACGELDISYLKQGRLKIDCEKIHLEPRQYGSCELAGVRSKLVQLFSTCFYDLPLSGKNGLKARTGLMVDKYDA